MKKIAIITLHRVINFGSALQAFALFKAVDKTVPNSVILIDYINQEVNNDDGLLLNRLCKAINFVKSCLTGKEYIKLKQKFRFHAFLKQISSTGKYTWKSIHKNPPNFHNYITGSDQVWNPLHMRHDYTYLLDFAKEGTRKCAYGASFGGNLALSPEYVKDYTRLLNEYRYVTVREKSGEGYFKKLTGKSARCVLDPTLLLSKDEWINYLHIPQATKEVNNPYILCYFVSYVFQPYEEAEKVIKELTNRYQDYNVICVGGIGCLGNKYKFISDAGPIEFIELLNKADIFITNSFHGTAFAINFRKKFITLLNPYATSDDRVWNILEQTGMTAFGIRCLEEMRNIDLSKDYVYDEERIKTLISKSQEELFKIIKYLTNDEINNRQE